MERTLSIIKPDATTRNITGRVNAMIEEAGLRIVAQKRVWLSKIQAEEFYAEHKDKAFFAGLVEFMTSAPVIVQVDRKSTRLNSSHMPKSRMPSSA